MAEIDFFDDAYRTVRSLYAPATFGDLYLDRLIQEVREVAKNLRVQHARAVDGLSADLAPDGGVRTAGG